MNWRFLVKPKWLLGHVIIIACVVLFVNLALWQLDRLHERQASNRAIRSQMSAAPVQLKTPTDADGKEPYRSVSLTGSWDVGRTVYIRYPIINGVQGYYVLTPFVVDGGAYIVNRGFIPLDEGQSASVADADLSPEETIQGFLRDYVPSPKPVVYTAGQPPLPTIGSEDKAKLRELVGRYMLADKWIQLTGTQLSGQPALLTDPELDEGPHRSYMLQWISFSILAIVGWGAVLRKTAKENYQQAQLFQQSQFADEDDKI